MTPIACLCGHGPEAHYDQQLCMDAMCDCAMFTAAMGTGEAAARRLLGDTEYRQAKRRSDEIAEARIDQQVWAAELLQARAEKIRASVRLLEVVTITVAYTIPALLIALVLHTMGGLW